MYITTNQWLEEGSQVAFMNCNMDGSDARSFVLDMPQNAYLSYINSDEQGNYYVVYDEFIEQNTESGESFMRTGIICSNWAAPGKKSGN